MIVNKTRSETPTLTVDTSAYADGDVVGGRLNLSDLCGAGGGGVVRQVLVVDADEEAAGFDVYLFDGQPTDIADQAAFAGSMTADDLAKLVGVVGVSSYTTVNGTSYAVRTGLDLSHGTGQLWAYLVLNGSTPTYTSSDDLTLKVTGWVD